MKKFKSILTLLVLLLSTFTNAQEKEQAITIADKMDYDYFFSHLKYFASDELQGRDVASEGYNKAAKYTEKNAGIVLTLALSYSSRWEILEATKQIAKEVKSGNLKPEDITEELFSSKLTTADIPDPELIIRTSGEYRISNFLLWQSAYTEFYFTPILWPDFDEQSLDQAIAVFQSRERRFGRTSDQVKGAINA